MSKYGNKKVVYDGIEFDSWREMYRYMDLKFLERCGAIKDLRRQIAFELLPVQREKSTKVYKKGEKKGQPIEGKIIEKAVSYIADFVYLDIKTGETIVEDVKGFRTKEYILKRKMLLFFHNIRIKEV